MCILHSFRMLKPSNNIHIWAVMGTNPVSEFLSYIHLNLRMNTNCVDLFVDDSITPEAAIEIVSNSPLYRYARFYMIQTIWNKLFDIQSNNFIEGNKQKIAASWININDTLSCFWKCKLQYRCAIVETRYN